MTDQTPYMLVTVGSPTYAKEIGDAVTAAVREKLQAPAICVSAHLSSSSDPTDLVPHTVVAVAFAGEETVTDDMLRTIKEAQEQAIPVLPIVCGSAQLSDLTLPLSKINAVEWRTPNDVVQQLVHLLGLVEPERKVFLSYKRSDTEALAFQLRYALQDRGFDVFLDRYTIPPAVDFQERLDAELSDKAFVLLLEGPTTGDSEWVRHEVTYALRQHISLVALALPDLETNQILDSVPEDLRIRLDSSEVMTEKDGSRLLRENALKDLLLRLEWEHARRLRRHRQQLVDTLSDWLRQSGHEVSSLPGWTLVAREGEHDGVYLITPREPTAADLRRADLARQTIDEDLGAIVAHNPEFTDGARRDLLTWIIGRHENLRAEHHAGLRLIMSAR